MKWADTQGDTRRDTQEIHGDERSSGADSPALAALIDQLAKKDEQIAKLMETVADGTKAVQGAQALHHIGPGLLHDVNVFDKDQQYENCDHSDYNSERHFFSSCFIHCSMFRTLIFLF